MHPSPRSSTCRLTTPHTSLNARKRRPYRVVFHDNLDLDTLFSTVLGFEDCTHTHLYIHTFHTEYTDCRHTHTHASTVNPTAPTANPHAPTVNPTAPIVACNGRLPHTGSDQHTIESMHVLHTGGERPCLVQAGHSRGEASPLHETRWVRSDFRGVD